MIFSSQLGKLDGTNTEQSLKSVANHLRKMQEELEYRLSVLDSSNITEIDADLTKFFVKGEEISNILADQDGKMSQFEQTVAGFRQAVADYEEGYSEWTQTVDGFTQQVGNYEEQFSTWQQTVDGFTQQVADYTTGYSSWQQTVAGFNQTVANYSNQYSSWQQTVDGFNQTVTNYGNQYSTWTQTVNGFQQTVNNMQTGLSMALRMDSGGVYITDQDGNMVTINGAQIDADTVKASHLFGGIIHLERQNEYGYINQIGRLQIDLTSTGYGLSFKTLPGRGGIQFESAANVSIVPGGSDYYVGIGGGGKYVSIQADMQPSNRNGYSCGTSSYPWSAVYAATGAVNTSDREKKNSIDYDTERYGKLFDLLKPCSFKMNDGTSDRRHIGMIAQDVEDAMESVGIASKDFAGFVKSPKKDEDEKIIDGEYDYFLRYSEFIGLCIAEIQKLKARVDELERKEQNDGSAG